MKRTLLFLLLIICVNFAFAQQNDEFRSARKYFDYQRFMLNNEFKKKFDKEENVAAKINIKKDFNEFMVKLDSVENVALIGALIKVRNREDLGKISTKTLNEVELKKNPAKSEIDEEAKYPGGFETMRKQVADLFYSNGVFTQENLLRTNVIFVVERDGSISSVHAEGENFTFNRQAEIAMYLLPEKFSPAIINGDAVRFRFRLPLAMNFE